MFLLHIYTDFSDYIYYESRFNISGGEKVCHDIQLLNDSTPETAELFQIWITSSNSEFGSTRALVKIYDDDGKIDLNYRSGYVDGVCKI